MEKDNFKTAKIFLSENAAKEKELLLSSKTSSKLKKI